MQKPLSAEALKKPRTRLPLSEHIYTICLSVLFSFALSLTTITSTTIPYTIPSLLICCGLFTLLFYPAISTKHGSLIFALTVLALSLLVGGYLVGQYGFVGAGRLAAETMNRLIDFLSYARKLAPDAERNITWGLTAAFSLLTVYCVARHPGLIFASLLGVGVFTTQVLTNNFKKPDNMTGFALFIVAILLVAVRRVNKSVAKRFYTGNMRPSSSFGWMTIPLCILVVLMAMQMPYAERDAGSINVGYWSNNAFFNNGFGEFSLASTGFGDGDAHLGGRVRLNHNPVLTLEADEPMYLVGHVKDTYTGQTWDVSDSEKVTLEEQAQRDRERLSASLDDMGNIPDIMQGMSDRLGETKFPETEWTSYWLGRHMKSEIPLQSARITYTNMSTRSILQPEKLGGIESPENYAIWSNSLHELFTNQILRNNFSYTCDYYDVETDAYAQLFHGNGLYERNIIADSRKEANVSSRQIREEKYPQYGDNIDITYIPPSTFLRRYVDLPESLPGRVRDLAEQITASCTNDYERVKAIEAYLMQFPYTLNPSATPPGEDFVDYFLFEEQQGYCTYYASALAVLARCVGVPTRYMEGFSPTGTRENGKYIVTNAQAHAWVEVYLRRYGWFRFEPTPPYAYAAQGTDPPPETFTPEMLEDPVYQEHVEAFNQQDETSSDTSSSNAASSLPSDASASSSQKPRNDLVAAVPVALLVVLGALLVGAALSALWIQKRQAQLRALPSYAPREGIWAYGSEMLRLTAYDGHPILPPESMMAYAARVGGEYTLTAGSLIDAARIFEQAAYSADAVPPADLQKMRAIYRELDRQIRDKHGKFRFAFARFILRKV